MAQFLRPDSDINTSGWTSTPLHSKVGDNSDATLITSSILLDGGPQDFECGLSDPAGAPGSGSYIMRVRARKGSGSDGIQLTNQLKEGASVRASFTANLTGTLATYSYTLSGAEVSSISNLSNLSMFVQADPTGSPILEDNDASVADIWFEIPDEAPSGQPAIRRHGLSGRPSIWGGGRDGEVHFFQRLHERFRRGVMRPYSIFALGAING